MHNKNSLLIIPMVAYVMDNPSPFFPSFKSDYCSFQYLLDSLKRTLNFFLLGLFIDLNINSPVKRRG